MLASPSLPSLAPVWYVSFMVGRCYLELTNSIRQLAYLIFKHFEPKEPSVHVALVFGVPALLSIALYQLTSSFLYAVLASHGAYWALLLLFPLLYRLSPFHPLADYPGPIGAKISKIYGAALMAQGRIYLYYRDLHNQYGDIVRVGTCL